MMQMSNYRIKTKMYTIQMGKDQILQLLICHRITI